MLKTLRNEDQNYWNNLISFTQNKCLQNLQILMLKKLLAYNSIEDVSLTALTDSHLTSMLFIFYLKTYCKIILPEQKLPVEVWQINSVHVDDRYLFETSQCLIKKC